MKQSSKRFSSILLALFFLVAAMIGFFDFLEPAYSDLQATKGQEIAQESFLANEKQIVTAVQNLVSSYTKDTQGEQAVGLALPSGPDVSGALAQLYGLAAANNVSIQTISVALTPPLAQAATANVAPSGSGQIGAVAAGANLAKPYGTLSFQVAAQGSYESFKNFLTGVETNIRIFDVKNLSFRSSAAQGKNQDSFTYSFSIITYYQS